MSPGPAFSVIVPAHDEERGLPHVLAKLTRGYPDAEIVVVDDGSTDATARKSLLHVVGRFALSVS